MRVSDTTLSLQQVRTETDAYPSHDAGAVGIYRYVDGGQLVLGAYRFDSPTDARRAADRGLNPERGVVAQLRVDHWLLLSQAPETERARSTLLSTGVSGGCRSELTFFGYLPDETFRLGSGDRPWQGAVVDLEGGSASELRASLDNPVPVVLTGETVHTAYVETGDYEGLQHSAEQSGFDVLAITSAVVEGLPVCEIRSRIQLPGRISESEVRGAFPDHVRIVKSAAASGARRWTIHSRRHSASEISNRLESLQVEEEDASVRIYSGCSVNG